MSFKTKIISTNQIVNVLESETVLEAALRQGVPYPYSCKAGRCGACKSRLKAGTIEHLNHLRFTLTEQEKAEGLFLACRSILKSDSELSWLSAGESQCFSIDATVTEKKRLTHDTWHITLKGPDNFSAAFNPGQFAKLRFPGFSSRSYSMANQPNSSLLEFFIRVVPGGQVTEFVDKDLAIGDRVKAEGPYGRSFLRGEHTGPILAVAGGSGIAPIKSIVDRAIHIGIKQKIYLYFGVRTDRDLYLSEYFSRLAQHYTNFHFYPVLEHSINPERYRRGRMDNIIFQEWQVFQGNWNAYLAGPPPMIETLAEGLSIRGINPEHIYSDPFSFESLVSQLAKSGQG